jgi:hypothetical protein
MPSGCLACTCVVFLGFFRWVPLPFHIFTYISLIIIFSCLFKLYDFKTERASLIYLKSNQEIDAWIQWIRKDLTGRCLPRHWTGNPEENTYNVRITINPAETRNGLLTKSESLRTLLQYAEECFVFPCISLNIHIIESISNKTSS